MGMFSYIDYFFSSNILRSLSVSLTFLIGGVAALFVPRIFAFEQGKPESNISLWAGLGGIGFGLGFMLLDALWAHTKILYLCATRDSLRERLITSEPVAGASVTQFA